MTEKVPGLSEIKRAHIRISKYVDVTPVMTAKSINEMVGAEIFFKCENFQKGGAFKMRGATNMIMEFTPEERARGFATHSSGNHAQAVALAAKLIGTQAYVVMPKDSTKVKIEAVKEYGAQVTFCEPNEKSRQKTCDAILAKTNAIFVPPFNDYRIIAGQATAAKELIEEIEDLDYILTPVGGGGLAAGTAISAKCIDPNIKVILGEPEKADDTFRSFKSGKLQTVTNPKTVADGLKVSLGDKNFGIIKELVEDVVTVSEKEIVKAMRIIWERMKIIIEPSSAVPFAVALKNKELLAGKRVGMVLTGGNVDVTNLPF
ncbi:MAG: pyridoxal-phosphate dependent enzyme [Cyclobacteriaceae bacterium]